MQNTSKTLNLLNIQSLLSKNTIAILPKLIKINTSPVINPPVVDTSFDLGSIDSTMNPSTEVAPELRVLSPIIGLTV